MLCRIDFSQRFVTAQTHVTHCHCRTHLVMFEVEVEGSVIHLSDPPVAEVVFV